MSEEQSTSAISTRTHDDQRYGTITRFLRRVAAHEIPKYEHSQVFVFPFLVGEEQLRKFDKRVREELAEVPLIQDVHFSSVTSFSDVSSVRFDSFDEFLAKAGDKQNPQSVQMHWSKIAFSSEGELVAGEVSAIYITEQRTSLQRLSAGEFNLANATLAVTGSDQRWTERVFTELSPHIAATQLAGVYKVLWIFRNKWIINIGSQVLAWSGFYVGINAASRFYAGRNHIQGSEILQTILQSTDVGTKINKWATYMLTPEVSPWYQPIVLMGAGASTYAVMYFATIYLLPLLTPQSNIAIGLSSARAQASYNLFRFVIFTLVIGSGLIPLLTSFVVFLLHKLFH